MSFTVNKANAFYITLATEFKESSRYHISDDGQSALVWYTVRWNHETASH